jgi:hypothetical protein
MGLTQCHGEEAEDGGGDSLGSHVGREDLGALEALASMGLFSVRERTYQYT